MASRMLRCSLLMLGLVALAGCRATESVHITNRSSQVVKVSGCTDEKPVSYRLAPGEDVTAEFDTWYEWWINEHYVVVGTVMLNEAGEKAGSDHVRYILNNGPHTYDIVEEEINLPSGPRPWLRAVSGSWLSAPRGCDGERSRAAPGVPW